eukprot:s5807_g11.t1
MVAAYLNTARAGCAWQYRDIFGWPICHGKNYISCQCVHTFTWLQRRWRQSLSANDLAMLVPSCRTPPPPKQDS